MRNRQRGNGNAGGARSGPTASSNEPEVKYRVPIQVHCWTRTTLLCMVAGLVLIVALGGAGYVLTDRFSRSGRQVPSFGMNTLPARFSVGDGNVEVVVELPVPPGNVAVSKTKRVLFNFHPEYTGPGGAMFAEVTSKAWKPRPDLDKHVWSVLSLRVDRQDRLWLLDFGVHGLFDVALVCFQLGANAEEDRFLFRYSFPRNVAGLGSMFNDFHVSNDGKHIYIADTSIVGGTPALVYYNVVTNTSHRLSHPESMAAEQFDMNVNGDSPIKFGPFHLRIGVDSIALSADDQYVYYGAVTSPSLYRIKTSILRSTSGLVDLRHIERFSDKCTSDGIIMDEKDNIYLTCFEQSAIGVIDSKSRQMSVLLRDDKLLRWPDGFSMVPGEDSLVVTGSALHLKFTGRDVYSLGPYYIVKVKNLF